jgi:hypothetical protein
VSSSGFIRPGAHQNCCRFRRCGMNEAVTKYCLFLMKQNS